MLVKKSANLGKGFTLVEMLVTLGLFLLLVSIVIVYSRTGERQILLFKEQSQVLNIIYRAKALSVETYGKAPGGGIPVPCAYGVHFDAWPSKNFLIFEDLPGSENDCSTAPHKYINKDTSPVVDEYSLDPAIDFSNNSAPTDIVFIPPLPIIIINGLPSIDQIRVDLQTNGSSVSISVTTAGQISTE